MSFDSPKRKRHDDDGYSSSPNKTLPLLNTLPPLPPECRDEGGASPRTTVAGKFQHLRLNQYDVDGDSYTSDERPSKRPHYSDDKVCTAEEHSFRESTPPAQDSTPRQTEGVAKAGSIPPREAATATATATATAARSSTLGHAISKFCTKSVAPHQQSPPPPPSPSPSKGELSDRYWQDSEITGHNPQDSDDDGYGINGIGFKPSSAIAYARLQKRKQQIADYRSREAKEARQRRSDRRRQGTTATRPESPPPPCSPDPPRKSRVRFQEACSIDTSG